MKKSVSTLLMLFAAITLFAQNTVKRGDVIYGTVTENGQPVAGVNVTERDGCDRIMAQAKTDVNGQFSFRTVNPDNRIMVTYFNHETVDIPINKQCLEIKIKELPPLPPVECPDGLCPPLPAAQEFDIDLTPQQLFKWESINRDILNNHYKTELNTLPQKGLHIQSAENSTFYSIDEFYDNWLFPIKAQF